ncbi:MAG: 1-acyl-sn-glycerol-3-phosphate acyltransferase [Cyanobacteria bacterium P01_A01_bin.123]
MAQALTQAQPPLDFIAPDFSPWVLQGMRRILPLWMRWKTPLSNIQVDNLERLARLYQQFHQGNTRFLIAFRHPAPEDAFCMAHLLWHLLPQTAHTQSLDLPTVPHAHFIYDRGIPLWAGQRVGWLYTKLGGTPIQRGKIDIAGLRSARHLFANGQFPMAAAPEGANNGHNEIVSPLEPGIAQMSFWCAEDLQKAQRTESVQIIPLGIQYRYATPPWEALEHLLNQLEQDSGLSGDVAPAVVAALAKQLPDMDIASDRAAHLYGRLYQLGEHLLNLMETYYRDFYQVDLPKPDHTTPPGEPELFPNDQLAQRLTQLLNAALTVAEAYFGLSPKGTVIDRCRRLEQAGWDRIYREDLKVQSSLSPVERGLADRIAEEASLRMWHMRIVESFVAVTGHYVMEKPTVERFAETTLLLKDMLTRIQGKDPFPRPQLGAQIVQMRVGEPLSVSDRWADYKQSRRQAVAHLTQALQQALEGLILT